MCLISCKNAPNAAVQHPLVHVWCMFFLANTETIAHKMTNTTDMHGVDSGAEDGGAELDSISGIWIWWGIVEWCCMLKDGAG